MIILSRAIKENQNRIKLSIKRTVDFVVNGNTMAAQGEPPKRHQIGFAEIEFQFLDWNDREVSNCALFLIERENILK